MSVTGGVQQGIAACLYADLVSAGQGEPGQLGAAKLLTVQLSRPALLPEPQAPSCSYRRTPPANVGKVDVVSTYRFEDLVRFESVDTAWKKDRIL